jgi:ABC-type glycerol-3-phosphate transport system substrate-binding protein
VAVAKLKLVVEFECPDTSAVEVDDLADQLDDYLDAFREEYPDVRIEPVDLVSPILERIQILRKAGLPVSFLWDGEQGYRFRVRKEWATDYLTEGAAWEWLQNFKMEVV